MIKVGSKVRCTISASQLSAEVGIVKEIEDDIALVYYPDLDERDLIDDVTFLHNNNGKYKEEKYIWLDIKMIKEIGEDIMFKVGDKVRYIGNKYIMVKDKIGIIKDVGEKSTVYFPDLEEEQYAGDGISLHNCGGEYSEKKYLYLYTCNLELVDEFHSRHYNATIEPIEYIMSNKLSFNRGNIIKYATRACKKSGQEKLDIHKIIDYAMLMAFEEGVDIDKDDIIKLVNYRFDWKKNRGDK